MLFDYFFITIKVKGAQDIPLEFLLCLPLCETGIEWNIVSLLSYNTNTSTEASMLSTVLFETSIKILRSKYAYILNVSLFGFTVNKDKSQRFFSPASLGSCLKVHMCLLKNIVNGTNILHYEGKTVKNSTFLFLFF